MRKIEKIAAAGNILYALSDGKVFSKHIGKDEWEAVPDLPQDESIYDYNRDIASLVESGTKAWADVPSATEFVEDLRGNDKPMHFASDIGIVQNPDPYDERLNKAVNALVNLHGLPMIFERALCIGQDPFEYHESNVKSAIIILANKLLSVGIKEDIPVFVLKPTDNSATYVIQKWLDINHFRNSDKFTSAEEKLNEFHDWQKANPSRVKAIAKPKEEEE